MKVYILPIEMVNALRSWFHPKDRSIILDDNTFIEGEELSTPGNPTLNRGRLYWKNGYWTQLNSSGAEQILTGPALIAPEVILSAPVASLTFTGIPQIFRHLQLLCQVRTDNAAEKDGFLMRFNSDTGGNYDLQRLQADNATVTAVALRAQASIQIATVESANARASNFSPVVIDMLGYSRSDAEKWALSHTGAFGDVSADGDLAVYLRASRWRNTTPISSITLLPQTGTNLVSGSRFQLYGVN